MISFFIKGEPRPGGSKFGQTIARKDGSLVMNARGKPLVVTRESQGKTNAQWKKCCAFDGKKAMGFSSPIETPLMLVVTFVMPRPNHHFVSGKRERGLRADAPVFCAKAPDATKLLRSTEDALTGIVWRDDCLVVMQAARKIFGDVPGAHVSVTEIAEMAVVPKIDAGTVPTLFDGK